MTPPRSELNFLLLILQKLPEDSQTGIRFGTAIASAVVEILSAAEAQTLAVRPAQQLGIHLQHERSGQHLVKIDAVVLKQKRPFVRLVLVFKTARQHCPNRQGELPQKGRGAAVADRVERGREHRLQDQDTRRVPNAADRPNRLLNGLLPAEIQLGEIQRRLEGLHAVRRFYEL